MVNVCFITPEFYPVTGGTGAYVYHLSRLLANRGDNVYVVTKGSACEEASSPEALQAIQIKASGLPLIEPLLFYRASRRRLIELKASHSIDVVHANLPLIPSFAVPQGLGKALVSTVHSTWVGEAHALRHEAFNRLNMNEKTVRLLTWLLKKFEDHLLKRSCRIIAVSEYTKKEILENYRVPAWKIKVIYNGVDLERFTPADKWLKIKLKRKLGFSGEEKLILYVGRLYSRKGLPTLIGAVPKVVRKAPNAHFLISGKGLGDEAQRLKRLVKKFGVEDKVHFLGYYPDEKLPNLYRAADLFVFPSIYENMPFAVLEALASGLSVVTTRVGGIPEIIVDGVNGFLIEPYDSLRLAEQLIFLIENPALAFEVSQAGRRTVEEKFNWKSIVSQVADVYREAIG